MMYTVTDYSRDNRKLTVQEYLQEQDALCHPDTMSQIASCAYELKEKEMNIGTHSYVALPLETFYPIS